MMELPTGSVRATNQVPAIADLQKWLETNEKSQQWLVDEINRLRREAGIAARIGRASVWRWENRQKMNIDDAVLIERITDGFVKVAAWSRHERRPRRVPAHRAPVEHRMAKTG